MEEGQRGETEEERGEWKGDQGQKWEEGRQKRKGEVSEKRREGSGQTGR